MIGKEKSLKTYHVRLLRQGRVSKCIRVEEGTEQQDQIKLQRILINAGISTPLEALLLDWLDSGAH